MEFRVSGTADGTPTWKLFSSNGQMVAQAGEAFASKSNATRAAKAFQTGALTARFEVYADAGGHWRWRAFRSSDNVASSGESFASKSNAQRAADNVQANAGTATGL